MFGISKILLFFYINLRKEALNWSASDISFSKDINKDLFFQINAVLLNFLFIKKI